jgi:hypothetical protein
MTTEYYKELFEIYNEYCDDFTSIFIFKQSGDSVHVIIMNKDKKNMLIDSTIYSSALLDHNLSSKYGGYTYENGYYTFTMCLCE